MLLSKALINLQLPLLYKLLIFSIMKFIKKIYIYIYILKPYPVAPRAAGKIGATKMQTPTEIAIDISIKTSFGI